MAIVLSLLTSLCFGAADFAGGAAARRTSVVSVTAGAHLIGLVTISGVALVIADGFSGEDMVTGAAAGAFALVGVLLLYRGLARGPMAVVAPLTAVTSAVIPVFADVADGQSFSGRVWWGLALAVVAIGVASRSEEGTGPSARVTPAVIVQSLLAGAGFGAFFIILDSTEAASAPWPVVGARLLTVATLGAMLLVETGFGRRALVRPDRNTLALIGIAGIGDTGANTLFLYATLEGDLAIVAVLSSLYPIVTVALAAILLDERPSRLQMSGAAAAIVATVLIASG